MPDLVKPAREPGSLGAPLRFQNAPQVVADLIREAVYDGRLKPGERLFEDKLAKELGVSRTPIREAIRLLQADGIVEAEPNRGAAVRTHSVHEVIDMYEAKAILEGYAAGRVAAERRPEVLAQLDAHLKRFGRIAEGDDIEQLALENAEFHRIIVQAGASPTIQRLALSISPWPAPGGPQLWYSPELKRRSVEQHRVVIDAIVDGSAEKAEAAMRHHLFKVRETMARNLRQLGTEGETLPY